MIQGLDKFEAHFAQHTKSFALIGGVACHQWLASQGLEFRATKDLDIVLIVEALDGAVFRWSQRSLRARRSSLQAGRGAAIMPAP